jgi:hypothetical protein
MKKIIITGLAAALALSSAVAKAELEVSGNVTTVTLYQHDDKDATALRAGGATQADLGAVDCPNCDHFRFVLDQVELDLENEFGENIRARADIDFRDVAGTVIRAADVMDLEQGYVTANLGIGNGMEFLIGKFDAPIGLESVDRHENVFSSYTPGYRFLMPTTIMGAKIYYEFNDNWSMDFAVVNNLNGAINNTSAYPSGLLRFGARWGEEGNETFIHGAVAGGPEAATAGGGVGQTAGQNKHYDMLGDLWGNWSIGDFWDIGWEATYRQSNSVTGGANQKAIAGQLYAMFQASDVWSVQWRVHDFWEINPPAARGSSGASTTGANWNSIGGAGTGFEGMTYGGSAAATYKITDDANMKMEYRFDFASTAGARANADYHTGLVEFAYSF